jgi:carbamoyl-phosphate synthase small subunit
LPSPAIIVLEDGAAYRGEALAGQGAVGGEIVFNTSMAGYQEIATDPSYCGQLITFTFPMNGNYGADAGRDESGKAHARAIIARELTNYRFNRASRQSWLDWLAEHEVLAVSGVDTRALTRHIRDKGALRAVVSTEIDDVKHLRKSAQGLPRMGGLDLAKVVTSGQTYEAPVPEGAPAPDLHVVAYDFGIKRNILRLLSDHGCRMTVVPAQTPGDEVLGLNPDGIFLSNGPGDPEPCTYAIAAIKRFLAEEIPVFGICLGHQLLGLAVGARTVKMKFGHHGANHPVQDLDTGQVFISSQNHGFAVDESTLPETVRPTHRSLFDGSLQGIACVDRPAFSFQGHPEASPGPRDLAPLFSQFVESMLRKSATPLRKRV